MKTKKMINKTGEWYDMTNDIEYALTNSCSCCSKSAWGSNIVNKNYTCSMLNKLARKLRAQKKRVI